MRDDGVVYVAGHPLLNRRCTSLPGCFIQHNAELLFNLIITRETSLCFLYPPSVLTVVLAE